MSETVELKPWPLGGYAPGNYSCVCRSCQKEFVGDKRAWQCLECAAISAKYAITRSDPAVRDMVTDELCEDEGCDHYGTPHVCRTSPVGDRVKPLEWKQFTERPGGLSAPSVVGEYVIRPGNKGGAHFRLWTPGMDYNAALRFLSTTEAKAAAQADYEQRILSALEPRTAPVRDRVTPKTGIDVTGFYRKCSPDTPGAEWGEGIGYYVHDEQARIEGQAAAAALRTSPPEPASGLPMPRGFADWKDQLLRIQSLLPDEDPENQESVLSIVDEMLDGWDDVMSTEAILTTPPAKEPQ